MRAVGGISLKVSPSFSCALIRGGLVPRHQPAGAIVLGMEGRQMVDVLEVMAAGIRNNCSK